jgi:hypothetical protein
MHKIIDNFFDNPYEVRQIALDLLAEKHSCIINDAGRNYPGVRCEVPNDISEYIINFLEKTFDTSITKFSCAFHITSAIHRLGLIHHDSMKYAGLIYLNEHPPDHSGTILCNPIMDENILISSPVDPSVNFFVASTTHDIKIISKYVEFKEQFNKNYEIEVELVNKFNRFVLYKGTRYHAPHYYFGNNLFNSRLVLGFWFNTV